MYQEALGGAGEGTVFQPLCRPSAPAEMMLRVAEKVRDSVARIERQMGQLPAETAQWRTTATELNVNGALSGDPKIQSAMFLIADTYVGMARSAEMNHEWYLVKDRLVEMSNEPRTSAQSLKRDRINSSRRGPSSGAGAGQRAHPFLVLRKFGSSAGEYHSAVIQHINAIGDLGSRAHILLDQ